VISPVVHFLLLHDQFRAKWKGKRRFLRGNNLSSHRGLSPGFVEHVYLDVSSRGESTEEEFQSEGFNPISAEMLEAARTPLPVTPRASVLRFFWQMFLNPD
jgi:hypothetical protein